MKNGLMIALVTVVGLVVGSPVRAEVPAADVTFEVDAIRDVAYYTGDDADPVRHRLDMFLPKGKKDYPVVFLVHGGAWLLGNKSSFGRYSRVGETFAEHGIGAVLPNYRLSPQVQHPEHIKDVARAFAWTVKNIGKHGGDVNRLFLSGHSAGGHLVSLLATDDRYLKAEGLDTRSIRGVIPISGVYTIPAGNLNMNFAVRTPNFQIQINNLDLPTAPLKIVFGENPAVRRDASPITHVKEGLPPFLIFYAETDIPTLPLMARNFGQALKDAKNEVQVYEVEDRNHMDILFEATSPRDPLFRTMREFITKH